jgi:hypothetical protein
VGERKLAALMKKMKESGKLDINKGLTNHSTRKYLLQRLRENNVEGTDIMKKHKKISKILSNTETNRNALVPVVSNLPRTTPT